MNYCSYQIILWVNHFYTTREQCEVLTGYLSFQYQPGEDWVNTWHWTKLLQSSFQTGSSRSRSYFHIFFPIACLEEAFIRNIIIIVCINYRIIICMNKNNAVISNNYGRLEELISLFRIPMYTRKNLFKICRQFGHASSEILPALT